MRTKWLFLVLLVTLLPTLVPVKTPSAAAWPDQISPSVLPAFAPQSLPWEAVLPSAPTRIWRSPWYHSDRTLYAVTDDALLQTADDGDTWTRLYTRETPTTTVASMAVDPAIAWKPPLFVVVNGPGAFGRVLRSTDFGISWHTVLTDTEKPVNDLAAVRDMTGALVVFAVGDQRIWRSANGGETWQPLHTALPESAYLNRVFVSPDFATDGTVYVTGFTPPIRSTDSGLSWETMTIPWVDIPRDVIFSPNYATDGTLWVSYFWVEGSGEEDLPMNGVVCSTDRGLTWHKAREGLPVEWPDGWILGLAVSPEFAGDGALFLVERVATAEGTAYEFYRSNNAGDSWVLQGAAPDSTPRGLLAVRRDLLFLPTNNGLYRLYLPCFEWIVNGACELSTVWDFPATPINAAYSTEQAHSPTRSIRAGLTTVGNKMGYSSARQRITLPSTIVTATLEFWLYTISTEVQATPFEPDGLGLPVALAGDVQYALLLDDQGGIIERLLWTHTNSRQWQAYHFDLSADIGQSFWLLFGVYNDGLGGKTGMYIDDVSLRGCRPLSTPPDLVQSHTSSAIQDFLVSDTADAQRNAALAYNAADDEYLAVWESVQSDSASDIVLQRLSTDGRMLGQATPLAVTPTLKTRPDVAFLPEVGRYLVVWQEQRTASSLPDIYGRLFTRVGVPDGAIFPISVAEAGQVKPIVAAGDSIFLVVWTDVLSSPARVRGQRVSNAGILLGSSFDISDGAGWAAFPDVAYNPVLGDFFVVWEDSRAGVHDDIYLQRVTPEGVLVGHNVAISNELGHQRLVSIAVSIANGRMLCAWNDWRTGTVQLFGRELDFSDGVPQTPEFRISTHAIQMGAPAVADWPDVAAGGYLVVWQAPTGDGDLLGRYVRSGIGPVGLVAGVSDAPGSQTQPALAVATSRLPRSALAIWQDARVGANTGILGQRLSMDGTRWGLHFGLSALPHLQTQPAVAYSSQSDKNLVVWADVFGGGGNQSTQVMGYLLTGDGVLARTPVTLTSHILTTTTTVALDWAYGEDTFLVTWSAAGDIIGQRVAADGNLIGGNFVVSALEVNQNTPVVVAGFNAYLVLFEVTDPLSQTTNVWGQLLTQGGDRLESEFDISRLTRPGQQALNPHATYDPINNVYFVVWQEQDNTNPGVPLWDIVGQIVAGEDGDLLGPRRLLADVQELQDSHPRIVWAGPEDLPFYLLVWTAYNMDTGQSEIMARRMGQDGAPETAAYPLTMTQVEQEGRPALSYDPLVQRFLVVWDNTIQGMSTATAIQGRQLGVDGRPEGAVCTYADAFDSARQSSAVIARRGHAEWLVVWQDGRADTALEHINVYARRTPVAHDMHLPLILK